MKKITKMSKEQYALKHNLKPEWFRDVKHISKFLNWRDKLEKYKKNQQNQDLPKNYKKMIIWAILIAIIGLFLIMLCYLA